MQEVLKVAPYSFRSVSRKFCPRARLVVLHHRIDTGPEGTLLCFLAEGKRPKFFLRAMTPSWSAHGTLYLCFPMKNFRVHSRMASYDGVFSRQHS